MERTFSNIFAAVFLGLGLASASPAAADLVRLVGMSPTLGAICQTGQDVVPCQALGIPQPPMMPPMSMPMQPQMQPAPMGLPPQGLLPPQQPGPQALGIPQDGMIVAKIIQQCGGPENAACIAAQWAPIELSRCQNGIGVPGGCFDRGGAGVQMLTTVGQGVQTLARNARIDTGGYHLNY